MYTTHGHHIPGSPVEPEPPIRTPNCLGVHYCARCSQEAKSFGFEEAIPEDNTDYILRAKKVLQAYFKFDSGFPTLAISTMRVVWFAKTLQNWKVLIFSVIRNGVYYEITYDGNKRQSYIDVYQKVDNAVITDDFVDGT